MTTADRSWQPGSLFQAIFSEGVREGPAAVRKHLLVTLTGHGICCERRPVTPMADLSVERALEAGEREPLRTILLLFSSALSFFGALGFLFLLLFTAPGEAALAWYGTTALAAFLSLSGIASFVLARKGALRPAAFLLACGLVTTGTGDLVFLEDIEGVAAIIYCVVVGLVALGIEPRQWLPFGAFFGVWVATGTLLHYFPVVEQLRLPENLVVVFTVGAMTLGLSFPALLFWVFHSSLARSRQEAWQLAEKALEASRAKTEFLGAMSHELRTPLNVLLGTTEMLREGAGGELPEPALGLVGKIEKYSRELLALVENALQVSQIEGGGLQVRSRGVRSARAPRGGARRRRSHAQERRRRAPLAARRTRADAG
ncbi:MAG: hypothetical protein KatS3mg076_1044 [Candidatus Binatia bacterium]|nr:MAG: hypothetical protein KatS3mg076_1044 [Candidatus Binatia bacterium]